jgi:glycosyltransferase involved in cell wall biosynthesis
MSQPQPLVSIITIVFNGEMYLEQTINSVLQQTYSNIEYIIIDGGSTDNSVDIIKKYRHRLSYWTSEPDNGISDAFNKGISKAAGEIIGLINADDWYEPGAVEKVVSAIKGYDVAYGNIAYWKNEKKQMITYGRDDFLIHEMSVNHPTVFVKRDCYEKYGFFDTAYKFAMDYDFVLRLKINHCRFVYLPSVLANMRWEGTSDRHWYKACKEALQIKNKYLPQKKIFNSLYFLKQISSIKFGRLLQKFGLNRLVHFYRRKLSPVKKIHS